MTSTTDSDTPAISRPTDSPTRPTNNQPTGTPILPTNNQPAASWTTESATSTDIARATPSAPRHRTALLRSLDDEWRRTRRRPVNLRRARGWSSLIDDEALSTALARATDRIGDLDDVISATQPPRRTQDARHHGGERPDPDEVLAALVTVAERDDLATRVVLQRILPGVISQSAGWSDLAVNCDCTDIAIGAAWIAIRQFDMRRTRRHVAATLISDVIWIAFRRAGRRMDRREVPIPNSVLAGQAAPPIELDPIVALAGTVRAAAAAGIDDVQLNLIRELVRVGSPGKLARQRQVSPRTIRNHRDAAACSIRIALGPDWAEWEDQLTAVA